ncbi:MAG: hypothetical protein QME21_08890 [Anaerolineales bacterium]|nr:hypothetical protein [Anaerolineales bacterium]
MLSNRQLLFLWVALLILSGCAAPGQINPPTNSPVITQTPEIVPTRPILTHPIPTHTFAVIEIPTEENMSTTPRAPLPEDPSEAALVQKSIQDLSARLGIPANEVEFVLFEHVIWPDGSMGCPQPDMMYIQVQREGYRILLRYQGRIYHYHGGEQRAPFLCEEPNYP